jgi:hypothetical protein
MLEDFHSFRLREYHAHLFLRKYFRRQVALPIDHGSWIFLLSPLLIGLVAGGTWNMGSYFIILIAFAAFLIRQPITTIIKIASKRRLKTDLPAAIFWTIIYAVFLLVGAMVFISLGYAALIFLAIPALPIFAWHLYLVSKRSERRQTGVEVLGSGVLALSAPAAYWVGKGHYAPVGWWLFLLAWLQSAASIVYAYLRLEQRVLKNKPGVRDQIKMGSRALLFTTFNFIAVIVLSFESIVPSLLPIPYALQWLETIWGCFKPAMGWKPARIGMRQLIVSILFTVFFILAWNNPW